MDNDAVRDHVRAALDVLPEGMINPQKVIAWALANKPNLEVCIPKMIEMLKDDFMSLGFEIATGTLDKDGFEQAMIQAVLTSKHAGVSMEALQQLVNANGKNS